MQDVTVSLSPDDELVITTQGYGASASISSLSGSAVSVLGFTGTETDIGQNVAGKFIVNGVEEEAIGTGRTLIGNSDNANTADLQLEVTLTTSQVAAGVDGTIEITKGISSTYPSTSMKYWIPRTVSSKQSTKISKPGLIQSISPLSESRRSRNSSESP